MPDATTLVAIGTFVLALVVYRATMLPGVGAWDTAENQTVPPLLGTMHPTGFPAYVILGWLATTCSRRSVDRVPDEPPVGDPRGAAPAR